MHEYALELRVLITYPAIETAFLHKPPSDSSHYATCSVSSVQRPTNYRQAHPICEQNGAGILPNLQNYQNWVILDKGKCWYINIPAPWFGSCGVIMDSAQKNGAFQCHAGTPKNRWMVS